MTTETPHSTTPRRQQLVTALLVGTVVVVLGVASGIGVDTRATSAPVTPQLNTTQIAAAPTPTREPAHYYGTAEPPAAPIVVAQPVTVAAAPSSTPSTTTQPTARPTAATTTAAAAAPAPTCSSGLLSGLLDALVGSTQSGGGLLGSGGLLDLGGLLGGSSATSGGLGGVLGILGPAPQTTAPAPAPAGGLLAAVTSLLPGVLSAQHSSAAPSAALASSCTAGVSSMLPLVGGLL